MKLSARRGQDLFLRHKGHFAFHYFRSVLLRMINSGRRVPLRRFRALFHSQNGGEKPDKIYSLRAYEEHVHIERPHISLYACQRSRRGLRSHFVLWKNSTTSIPTGRPIVLAGVVQLIRMNLGGIRCWINPGRGRYRDTRYTGHPAKFANVQRNFILAKIPFARMECKFIRGIPLAVTF